MNDKSKQFEEFENHIDELLRSGKDINFEDVKTQIEQEIWFFKNLYQNNDYLLGFSENELADINNNLLPEIHAAFNWILSKDDWQSSNDTTFQDIGQRKQTIKNVNDQLVSKGYFTKLQAARGSNLAQVGRNDYIDAQQKAFLELDERAKVLREEQEKSLKDLSDNRLKAAKIIDGLNRSQAKAEKSLAKQIESSYGKEFLKRANS
jgi:hypothetical protein